MNPPLRIADSAEGQALRSHFPPVAVEPSPDPVAGRTPEHRPLHPTQMRRDRVTLSVLFATVAAPAAVRFATAPILTRAGVSDFGMGGIC